MSLLCDYHRLLKRSVIFSRMIKFNIRQLCPPVFRLLLFSYIRVIEYFIATFSDLTKYIIATSFCFNEQETFVASNYGEVTCNFRRISVNFQSSL